MKKRILAFILCICMMLELIPSSVYAAENGESTVVPVKETVSGGDVSSNDVTGGDENGTHKEQQVYGDTSGGDDVSGNDPVEVTRIEWLHQLTQTFEMKVEEDNYPDNYFSDVDSSSKYYYDLMLATEFGLVDVEAGDPFEPDKAATREFAAHTLNHCLGFQLDEENYTFTEADSVTYPNDIQAIINQGWLSLSDGAFLPNKGITADEEAFLLAQAKEVYNSTKIDPNHVNTWEYTDDVIALPEGTKAEYTSDTEITIYNCPAELKAGDKFGIVEQGLPIVKKVSKVVSSGEDYVIEVEDVSAEEAFKNIDVQGSLNADITDFEAADGVQISYIVGGSLENKWEDGTEYETLGEVGNQEVSAISLTTECDIPQEVKTKYDLPNDFKLEVSYKLSDLNPQYGHDKNGAFFKMNATAILNCNVSTEVKEDLIKDPNIKKSLILGEWTILLVGKVKCSLDLELSGKITFTLTERITLGVQASIFHGFRTICSFEKECFTIEAKVTAFIGLKFSVEFNVIALTGKIYATVGAEANATITAYDDGEAPATCADISAYLVATIGASATLELWLYKDSWDEKKGIYDETNSPVRIHLHWDDGTPVSECYRDREITEDPDNPDSPTGKPTKKKYKYYTPITSKYTYSGASSGKDEKGEPYTIFKYSLDDDDNATITQYNGNVSALTIPETLDGHTVVGIAKEVFKNNTRLKIVNIPNSVTSIGDYAFEGCSNLYSITLSKGLTKLGQRVFANCKSLAAVEIPKNLQKVGFQYSDYTLNKNDGVFVGCTSLKTVRFEEGITLIPAYLFKSCPEIEKIEMPDTVTQIGTAAFAYCEKITDVKLSLALTDIGAGAFFGCTSLETIELPDSVTVIENKAFADCKKLKTIKLSENLTTIGYSALKNCTNLEEIEIPKSLQSAKPQYSGDYTIDKNDGVFAGCTSLKTVRFEEKITLIPAYLFKSCPGIEKIEIPDTVTQIGTAAFAYCEKITDVKLSSVLTTMGSGAFAGCSNLKTIELPDSVTVIENRAFSDCKKLESIKLSKNLATIGYSALKNCTNLEEIEIPKSLQSAKPQYSGDYTIDKNDGVFAGCTSLKTVRFEEEITLIPAYLFKSCPGIEKIEIPDTVTQIGTAAFAYCEKITDVKLSLALTTMGSGAFAGCSNLKTIELPDSVTVIENRAFSDCKKLESIRLSKKLTTIGYSALKNCTNLEEIEIPKSLKSVKPQYSGDYTIDKNDGVFAGCTSLKTVRFEEGIAIIPDCLFKSCPGIEKIEIPDTVTKIDAAAFAFCDNLQEVSIPDSVEEIGNNVFDSCVSLKEVNLPDTLDSMGTYIFSNCTALTKIHIPKIRQNITEGTFYNCTSLKEINIPQTVIAIRKKAFYNCDSLENMAFSENTKIIEEYAFYDCDALKEVVLPDKLTSLAQYAFYGCDALEKVTIANSLTSMGNNVFDSCKELKEVTLGNGLQTIPANAFSNCGKLTEMVFPYGVTSIAKSAFVNDTSLFNITLPRTVSSIDSTAFSYTDKMTVYGVAGTYAQEWAESVGATFVNKEVNATEITLDRTEITMTKGNSDKLILNITPADCTDAVNWKCTDTSVVTVDSTGNLTAKAVGTATVKVTVGNLSATCKITVVQPVTSISLNKTSVAMDALDTYQLVASPYPNNAFNKEVSWKSSNENVATVDQTGLVTAIAKGSATITVTAMDGSNISKTCSITVRNNANIITVVDELESPHPYANSCSDKWVYTLKDAEKLLVTFSSDTMMEDGFDFLYIYDKDKNQIGKYTGNELAGKTITVPGDTVIIKMSSDDGGTEYGFKVIDVSAAEQERVAMPVADITSQEVAYGTKITLSTDTEGASIYYTVDGSLPTKDSILYTKAIVIEKDMTIKAIALREDYADSAVATYVYTVAMCTVTFDSNGGSPVTEQKIYKGQPLPLLEIPVRDGWHFDGWYWNEQLFDLSQPVNSDMTLVAHWSEFEALGMPSANRKSGTELKKGTRISLTTEEADTTIYYTIDGTEPTINSQIYTAPIVVNEEITIKAFAVKEGYKNSEVATFHYTISEDEDIWGDVDPDDIPEDGIPDGMWVAGVTDVEYTGKPIKPAIRVYDGKTRLTEKKDYTVTYKNNTNAAGRDAVKAPSITVTGKGNYEGKTTITFAILPQDISEDNPLMIADNLTTAYNGRAQKPVPVITFAGKKLTAKKDYVVTCTDTTTGTYKEAGTYDIILNGVGNYTGTRVITYTVTELIPISKVKVSNIKPYTYDWYGSYEYYPEFTLKDGKYTLVENEDYVVTYLNNNQVGTAYLLIEGIGRYTGTRRVPFKINGYSISKGSVWYRGNGKYTYNGEPHTPECYVEVSTGHNSYSTLYENEGFTLQFINNVNAGKATLIFTGINGYSGTLKRTIKIDPFDISADTEDAFHVDLETEVGFCKTGATPKPVITFNGTVLTEGKDYTLKYANNKKVASMGDLKAPTVTITGKGNFKGTRTVTFDIVPQDLSNLTLEAADKVFQNKAKNYTTKFDVLDSNGKKLAVKKDYEIVKYTYADGSEVKDTDIIPAGTNIFVTVKAKEGSGFTGELTGSYRIVQADISKVTAKVMDQTYTGSVITPGKEEITLTMKKVPLTADDYEIVSYSNNVKKGTATVIIRGVGNYGGTKKITFKIKSKKVGFLWW